MDYSKWDHIEVSDDEDDTHPNIDTASLFRWRHEARLTRDREWKEEKEKFEKEKKEHIEALQKARSLYEEGVKSNAPNVKDLEENLRKLEVADKEWQEKEKEMNKKERLRPLNVDTISHEGRSRTFINKEALKEKPKVDEDNDDDVHEEAADRLRDFVKKHEAEIRKFGMFSRPVDSQQYLLEKPFLVCDETANHLVLWCLDLAMEEKYSLLDHVSHQCIVMQFMLELAKSLKCDPRSCIRPFFNKFINPEPEYQRMFEEELTAFKARIRDRARVKLTEAMQQYEEEERQKRLGPGGLDPYEVIETLPEPLRKCFETRDVELLKKTLTEMDPKEAEECMKRCIASGLWVENAAAADAEGGEQVYDTTNGVSMEEVKASAGKENVKKEEASANSGDNAPNKS
ncbi:Hsp90 co-chaperone Cdc37 [Taenia solium]|eukprot:TsM_000676700 transcript=TsM_000676700 gene=TsM_000676700